MSGSIGSQLLRRLLVIGGQLLLVPACTSLSSISVTNPKPRAISAVRHAVVISVGTYHACALLQEGTIQCWGGGSHGELGSGDVQVRSVTPVTVAGITNAAAIAAGTGDSCALLQDGQVRCWGGNPNGELGKTPLNVVPVPTPIPGITNATAIINQNKHFCALLAGGTVRCWGDNGVGQLGNGSHVPLPYDSAVAGPVAVIGITNAAALAAGSTHTCAVLRTGTVKCWGSNLVGELGNGSLRSSDSPVEVEGITNAVAIAAGGEYSCALLTDATIRCWGAVPFGTRRMPESSMPKQVRGITSATAIAAGSNHICALIRGGTVKCWGSNRYGELGDSTMTDSEAPVEVQGLSNATAVSVGPDSSCALLNDGSIRCWGRNVHGNLGDGTTKDSPVPVAVLDLTARPARCKGAWPSLRTAPLPERVVRQWFEAQGAVPTEPLPTCHQKLTWPGEPKETLLCILHHFTGFGSQQFAELLVVVLGVQHGLVGYWFYRPIAAGTATDASCGQYRAIDRLLIQLELSVDAENQTFIIRDLSASTCSDSLAELARDSQRGTIAPNVQSDWRSEVDDVCRSRGVYPWRDGRFERLY